MIDIKKIPSDFLFDQHAFFYQCFQISYSRVPAYSQVFLDKHHLVFELFASNATHFIAFLGYVFREQPKTWFIQLH
jgi:hypothetical protein